MQYAEIKLKMIFKLRLGKMWHQEGNESMRVRYQTKQREEILAYLESVGGNHVTVHDICQYFEKDGISIGTTTVYRQLERLMEEGLIQKYIIDEKSAACFEYVGKDENCHHPVCFHCKCEKCGRLIHLDCKELEGIQEHMLKEHGFALNPFRTVLYGVCEQCAR